MEKYSELRGGRSQTGWTVHGIDPGQRHFPGRTRAFCGEVIDAFDTDVWDHLDTTACRKCRSMRQRLARRYEDTED